jgi:hypothetical protein
MSHPMANGASLPPKTATIAELPFSYHGVHFIVLPQDDGYWFVVGGGPTSGPYATPHDALVAVSAWIDSHSVACS